MREMESLPKGWNEETKRVFSPSCGTTAANAALERLRVPRDFTGIERLVEGGSARLCKVDAGEEAG